MMRKPEPFCTPAQTLYSSKLDPSALSYVGGKCVRSLVQSMMGEMDGFFLDGFLTNRNHRMCKIIRRRQRHTHR